MFPRTETGRGRVCGGSGLGWRLARGLAPLCPGRGPWHGLRLLQCSSARTAAEIADSLSLPPLVPGSPWGPGRPPAVTERGCRAPWLPSRGACPSLGRWASLGGWEMARRTSGEWEGPGRPLAQPTGSMCCGRGCHQLGTLQGMDAILGPRGWSHQSPASCSFKAWEGVDDAVSSR